MKFLFSIKEIKDIFGVLMFELVSDVTYLQQLIPFVSGHHHQDKLLAEKEKFDLETKSI